MSKPICRMNRVEAEAVLAQEYKCRERCGRPSVHARRIGSARARIAQLNPITREQIIADLDGRGIPASVVEEIVRRYEGRVIA
jgi:hypothetical protein